MPFLTVREHYKKDTFSFTEKGRGIDPQEPPSCGLITCVLSKPLHHNISWIDSLTITPTNETLEFFPFSCSSSVGKAYWRPGPQTIILDYPCLEKVHFLERIFCAVFSQFRWHSRAKSSLKVKWQPLWDDKIINI